MTIYIKTNEKFGKLTPDSFINQSGEIVPVSLKRERTSYIVTCDWGERNLTYLTYTKAADESKVIQMTHDKQRMRIVDMPSDQDVESVSNDIVSPIGQTVSDLKIETTKLRDIDFDPRLFQPIKTGTYIDDFFSYKSGIMPGINVMVTGDPGVGKSSNLMDILINIKKTDQSRRVLYVSAEMTEIDVKEFEEYYPEIVDIDFLYIGNYATDPDSGIKPYQALTAVLNQGWDVVVMDSLVEVQGLVQEDLNLPAKKTEKWLLDLLRMHNSGHNAANIYTTFLCIQQMNKSGSYVGSKRLEHMTAAFIALRWDAKEAGKRYMVFEKNRKGKEKVKLYYSFAENGGIVYDDNRHTKELEIMNRIQTTTSYAIEEVQFADIESLFKDSDVEVY